LSCIVIHTVIFSKEIFPITWMKAFLPLLPSISDDLLSVCQKLRMEFFFPFLNLKILSFLLTVC
jgi:hypothetical protein